MSRKFETFDEQVTLLRTVAKISPKLVNVGELKVNDEHYEAFVYKREAIFTINHNQKAIRTLEKADGEIFEACLNNLISNTKELFLQEIIKQVNLVKIVEHPFMDSYTKSQRTKLHELF